MKQVARLKLKLKEAQLERDKALRSAHVSHTLVSVILQQTATHCNTLQHTATHCNTLQHTATHTLYCVQPMCRTLL